ncbi:MAG: TetR/AcrR family transcriptional regulator [Actinomycetota bacterium]|nr:TetR/AcrR family transcriptional regulator [Actinomycetota bacterium]
MTLEDAPCVLRSDAERNRARILAAARQVFATEGLSASMASVAREAGVGIATMFRRFPTKEELIAGVFADRMNDYAQAAIAGLEDEDPWRGLSGFIERACELQAADSGFADVLTIAFPGAKELDDRRAVAYDATVRLIERAKAAGRLREDFTPEDLMLLHMANAGVIAATRDHAPTAWRRVTAQLLQSFQPPSRGILPAAPSASALHNAMLNPRRRNWHGADPQTE